jgi:acyl-[acyl-carrier-protein] desaturase
MLEESFVMDVMLREETRALERKIWALYYSFFDHSEKTRRWSLRADVPWDQCNRGLDPSVVASVEAFYQTELYVPDYLSLQLTLMRPSKGRSWFFANWGYEESKHALALGDWLERSGQRTPAQLAELERKTYQKRWQLPHDDRLAMTIYGMAQELSFSRGYANLREEVAKKGGDPALSWILTRLSDEERAHHDFFGQCVALHLEANRPATLERLQVVLRDFVLPAGDLLSDERRHVVESLCGVERSAYRTNIVVPILGALGVEPGELGGVVS